MFAPFSALAWLLRKEAAQHAETRMAAEDHVARLRQGVEAWNQWRRRNSKSRPALVGARLRGADLREVDLGNANLFEADLRHANLFGANLRGATLLWADLRGADLREADLSYATLFGAKLRGPTCSARTCGTRTCAMQNSWSRCIPGAAAPPRSHRPPRSDARTPARVRRAPRQIGPTTRSNRRVRQTPCRPHERTGRPCPSAAF